MNSKVRRLLLHHYFNFLKECVYVLSLSLKINFKGWVKKKENIWFMVEFMVQRQGPGQNCYQGFIQAVELTDVGEAPCCRWPVLRCGGGLLERHEIGLTDIYHMSLILEYFTLCCVFCVLGLCLFVCFSAPSEHGSEDNALM